MGVLIVKIYFQVVIILNYYDNIKKQSLHCNDHGVYGATFFTYHGIYIGLIVNSFSKIWEKQLVLQKNFSQKKVAAIFTQNGKHTNCHRKI